MRDQCDSTAGEKADRMNGQEAVDAERGEEAVVKERTKRTIAHHANTLHCTALLCVTQARIG